MLMGMTFAQTSETNMQTLKWLDPHSYLLSAKGLWFAKQAWFWQANARYFLGKNYRSIFDFLQQCKARERNKFEQR